MATVPVLMPGDKVTSARENLCVWGGLSGWVGRGVKDSTVGTPLGHVPEDAHAI